MDINPPPTITHLAMPVGDAAADHYPAASTANPNAEHSKQSKFIHTTRRLLNGLLSILSYSYLSPFLIFSPIAVAAHVAHLGLYTSFSLNLLALILYAAFIAAITEELAEKTGPVTGALINITLGNTPEVIVLIIALRKGEIEVVQAAIVSHPRQPHTHA